MRVGLILEIALEKRSLFSIREHSAMVYFALGISNGFDLIDFLAFESQGRDCCSLSGQMTSGR